MHKVKQRESARKRTHTLSTALKIIKRAKMQETARKQMSKVMKIRSAINNKCRKKERRKGQKEKNYHRISGKKQRKIEMHKVKQRERARKRTHTLSTALKIIKREKMQERARKQMSKVMKIRSAINNKCRKRKEGKDRKRRITTEYQNLSAPSMNMQ